MDIDWSEYRKSPSYRATVDAYLAGEKLRAAQPRREWQPQRVSAAMIRICDKRGLDVRDMTATEAAEALRAHIRPVARPYNPNTYDPNTATPAEVEAYINHLFGPV